jgi:hypothetical protein
MSCGACRRSRSKRSSCPCHSSLLSLTFSTPSYIGPCISKPFMDTFTSTIIIKRHPGESCVNVEERLRSRGIFKSHTNRDFLSRANVDAINVHPVEFFLGEYNHLWSLFLCCSTGHFQIHILGVFLFLVIGGITAGLNHTRFDIVIPFLGIKIFDSKAHDVHHRIPQSNYGQYTMFWDYIFGTYRYVLNGRNVECSSIFESINQ